MSLKVFKRDKYKSARGGGSKLLEIQCANCNNKVCVYQKDGVGSLKRLYIDRIKTPINSSPQLICNKCNKVLGVLYIYQKEKRLAYRLFPGLITKRILKLT